jgi:GNAT superfamily N-acetyltransferase
VAEIVTLVQRPDLIPTAARWIWQEWERHKGRRIEGAIEWLAQYRAAIGPDQGFVLLDGGVAAGTASFVHDDLDARPELTPWLASVYVDPAFRGRGYAVRLVRFVEAECRRAGIATLWLHTAHAAGLYAKLGWQALEEIDNHGERVTLMRRDFEV